MNNAGKEGENDQISDLHTVHEGSQSDGYSSDNDKVSTKEGITQPLLKIVQEQGHQSEIKEHVDKVNKVKHFLLMVIQRRRYLL